MAHLLGKNRYLPNLPSDQGTENNPTIVPQVGGARDKMVSSPWKRLGVLGRGGARGRPQQWGRVSGSRAPSTICGWVAGPLTRRRGTAGGLFASRFSIGHGLPKTKDVFSISENC